MSKVTVIAAASQQVSQRRMRVAAYCRVSTTRTEQKHSQELQQSYFQQLLSASDHEELVCIYADCGSGTSTAERPDFCRMMEDCRSGKIDRIVTKSLSRFARNTRDCLVALRELKQLGVSVYFDKENIDTAEISDEILLTILEGLAQEESASISHNIRWSLKKKMAAGTLGIARVPYGYIKNDQKQLVIDEETAAVVRRIFSLYLSGYGARAIAVQLNREGLPSPTGILWNNITILKMLRQEKYIGDIRWQKTYSVFMGEKYKINCGQQDSFYIRDGLPPIISREDFMAVQVLRKRNTHTPKRVNCSLFRGKTKCTCGRSYYFAEKGYQAVWICSGRHQLQRPCQNRVFPDTAYHAAWNRLCEKLRLFACELLLPCIFQLQYLDQQAVCEKIKSLEVEQEELRRRRYVLYELCAGGCISEERLFRSEQDLTRSLQNVQNQIETFRSSCCSAVEQLENLYRQLTAESDAAVLADSILQKTVTDGETAAFELVGGLQLKEVL